MRQLKTPTSDRNKRMQKQDKKDLEQEWQQCQQSYDRERSTTQEIPAVSMYNLVQGDR